MELTSAPSTSLSIPQNTVSPPSWILNDQLAHLVVQRNTKQNSRESGVGVVDSPYIISRWKHCHDVGTPGSLKVRVVCGTHRLGRGIPVLNGPLQMHRK